MIYPHASERDLSRIATDGNRDLDLPEGWTGTFAPDLKTGGARYLAVANFDGSETYASLSLHTDRGAPVFSRPTRIRQNKGRMDLRLNPLESFGECCEMLLETTDGGVLQARRMPNGLYTVQPLNRREMTVWVRPLDPKAGKIRVLDPTGEVRQEIAFDAKQREDGLRVAVTGRTLLEIVTDRPDGIGPAVEIEDVRIREDGRATVTVVAKDVSGLASVELFCDGRSLGEKSKAPFIWNARPSEGFHTFHGLAKDASAQRNARRSMKQTVYVGTSVPSVRLVR